MTDPLRRQERLERWLDRPLMPPDPPSPFDVYLEIGAAAKAAGSALAAVRHQRRAYPSRDYVTVPWDGAGGEYRVWLDPRPHVDGRDEYYLGSESSLALERFVESVLGERR